MKALLTIFTLACSSLAFASTDLAKDIEAGSEFQFESKIQLTNGQKSILVANRKCRLNLGKTVQGEKHITSGTVLVSKKAKYKGEWQSFNPSNGDPITVKPSIKIKFIGNKAELICRGDNAESISVKDLEAGSLLKIKLAGKSPDEDERAVEKVIESTPFTF